MDPLYALHARNAERRRAVAEIVGWARVLEHVSPRVIDRHDDPMVGELLEVVLPPAQDPETGWDGVLGPYTRHPAPVTARFLRVRCGTGRTFALRVPVSMQTALQANAWTYSLTPEEYNLEART
jgi:hypothetical protein